MYLSISSKFQVELTNVYLKLINTFTTRQLIVLSSHLLVSNLGITNITENGSKLNKHKLNNPVISFYNYSDNIVYLPEFPEVCIPVPKSRTYSVTEACSTRKDPIHPPQLMKIHSCLSAGKMCPWQMAAKSSTTNSNTLSWLELPSVYTRQH